MDSKKIIKRIALVSIVIVIVYILIDYFNLSSMMFININNINEGLFGIVVNTVIVISLYLVTFEFVDKKNEDRQKNKQLAAKRLLIDIYNECLLNISIMEDPDLRSKATRYVKGDELIEKDNKFRIFEEAPFNSEPVILDFIKDGVLSIEEYNSYLDNKKNYHEFMYISLIFPDLPDKVESVKKKVADGLRDSINKLNQDFNKNEDTK